MRELPRNPRLIMAKVVGTVERVSGERDVVWHEGLIIPRDGKECSVSASWLRCLVSKPPAHGELIAQDTERWVRFESSRMLGPIIRLDPNAAPDKAVRSFGQCIPQPKNGTCDPQDQLNQAQVGQTDDSTWQPGNMVPSAVDQPASVCGESSPMS